MPATDVMTGISPELRRKFVVWEKAMSGDIVFSLTPSTVSTSATDVTGTTWTRTVYAKLVTAAGELHDWFTGNLTAAIADTSTSGTAAISTTTIPFVDGKATITVTGDAVSWLKTETDTLTMAATTALFGRTVAAATSVETFIT